MKTAPIPSVNSQPRSHNPFEPLWNFMAARPYLWVLAVCGAFLAGHAYATFKRTQAVILTQPDLMIYRDKATGRIHIK